MGLDKNLLIVQPADSVFNMLSCAMRRDYGFTPIRAVDADEAVAMAAEFEIAQAITEIRLRKPQANEGLDLIAALRGQDPDMRIAVVTRYDSLATATRAIALGAVDYFPFKAIKENAALLGAALLGWEANPLPPPIPEKPMSPNRVQWERIQRVLASTKNIPKTARLVSMPERTLRYQLAKAAPA